ncbi:MAG: hypothetical protein JXA25_07540 [Anaerolineales bacterium]|nr:hypothetical protein [Anaerolineales bacterium]
MLRTGQPNGTESIGTWLLLAAVTVRLAFQKFTEEKSEKGYEYRIFSNFLNSAMSLSLLQISGFMQGNIAGKGLVIIITTAILISGIPALLSNRDNAIFFKAFSVYVAGLTLLIISLDPLHSGECVLMGVIILLCGAGVVFLQPYYKESHKIPVAIFAAMLIGMPFTPSGLWAVSWAGIAGIGPSVVFMILIPVFIAVLVFTLYQYREVSLQSWPDQEVITRALHIAGPVVPLVSAVVVSIWNGPGFTGLLPWSMMALVAGLVLVISRVRIRLMESINQIASRIPKLKLDKTVVIVGNLEQSIQRSMEEIENFLEGENSFLWIMLVLVVVALFNWR